MSRRFISELGERETIDQVFLVADKQLRTNRQGNFYLQMRLSDRSGSMTGMMWNANDKIYGSFDNGDYVHVQGTSQFYNGAMQMIVNQIDRALDRHIDEADFVTLGPAQIRRLTERMTELLRAMQDAHLRELAEGFLQDAEFMAAFTNAPAGIKHHHAYCGGLLEHVVSLMEVVVRLAPLYTGLDGDQLLLGAFLHDAGKTRELTHERDLAYSDEGQLLGHLVIAVEMLDRKVQELERRNGRAFPPELVLRLKHMILSHHGEYEFGSPKLPMTLEAVALHHLDNLDAKLHGLRQLMRDDPNTDSNWTTYQPALRRKLFKGSDLRAEEA